MFNNNQLNKNNMDKYRSLAADLFIAACATLTLFIIVMKLLILTVKL